MIIKALTLENFKGIREPVRVEFAPVTLLFGPNNAGKSTIVQALHYAREVFERNNTDAGPTQLGGDIVDLGGFRNLVYRHDLSRVIRMRFELDLSEKGLPDYSEWVRDSQLEGTMSDSDLFTPSAIALARDLPYVWVEFEIARSRSRKHPRVSTYRVGSGTRCYAIIDIPEDSERARLSFFDVVTKPFRKTFLIEQVQISHDDLTPETQFVERGGDWLLDVFKALIRPNYIPTAEHKGQITLGLKGTALPEWGRRLDFDPDIWLPDEKAGWEMPGYAQEYLSDLLTALITGPGERLLEALKDSIYLSPFREMPPRHYQPAHSPEPRRWANGLAAWDWMILKGKELVEPVNEWLVGEDRFNAGYKVEVTHYRELDIDSPLMAALSAAELPLEFSNIRQQLDDLPEGKRLQIRDGRSGVVLFPQDLGVGVSQVVPVLVAALHNKQGVVMIEEPESNIHPAFQVVLADLFMTQAKANPQVLFLVETHSEHLMLRCLRRIRESAKGILPEGLPVVRPEDVAVHFIESTKDGPDIHRIEIDEEGDFIDDWPGGFFEESYREKFAGR